MAVYTTASVSPLLELRFEKRFSSDAAIPRALEIAVRFCGVRADFRRNARRARANEQTTKHTERNDGRPRAERCVELYAENRCEPNSTAKRRAIASDCVGRCGKR